MEFEEIKNQPWFKELMAKQQEEEQRAFTATEEIKTVEFSGGQSLAFDMPKQLVRVGLLKDFAKVYRFSQIEDAALRIDDEVVISGSTTSTLARAATLGALTGGAGAIVGALTASKTQRRTVKRIELVLKLPDSAHPFVYTLHANTHFKGYRAQEAEEIGNRLCKLINAHIAAAREAEAASAAEPTQPGGFAEDLASIADLYTKGLLTKDEFEAAKAKLLKGG
jgi:hypothetical protein